MASFAAFTSSIASEINEVLAKLDSVSNKMSEIKGLLAEVQIAIEAFADLNPKKFIELESGLSASAPLQQFVWHLRILMPRLEIVIRTACGEAGIQLDQIRTKIISAKTTFASEEASADYFVCLDTVVQNLDELCNSLASAPDIYHAQFSSFLNS